MELITGGIYQGKREYAVNTLHIPQENIIDDFNDTVREMLLKGEDVNAWLDALVKARPQCAVIVDEVGCGIVPPDPKEREYRMVLGRLACVLSERAEHVYRVVAGLGIRLK